MNKVRWGLLSTAHINRRLIPALRASQRGELAAVASRDLDRARNYAQKWDIPAAFGSYQGMLNSDEIDAVYISLPNHLHAQWAIASMQAGKHVLCEKPIAIKPDEVDRMIEASHETGMTLAEAFMYRHHPQTQIVGEWVHSGRLGEISLVRGAFNFIASGRPNDIRLIPEYGGGSLWDVGVYPLSLAQYVYGGPPQRVSGFQWTGDTGVDETFAGQLSYPGGGLAQITSSLRASFYTMCEIIGTQGRLHMNRPFVDMGDNRRLTFYPNQGEVQEVSVPEKELYVGEVEDMHAAILDGAEPYLSLYESRDHIHTVLALYQSAQEGQVVELD
jgi:xylose dehydrogenase (NAD/NADP)